MVASVTFNVANVIASVDESERTRTMTTLLLYRDNRA